MSTRQIGWPYKKEFACHRCGNCCRGEGYVAITESDIARAARFLGITEAEYVHRYTHREKDGSFGLIHQGDLLQSCIHLKEENGLFGCEIHKAKPEQCAVFPFGWRPRDAENFCAGIREAAGIKDPLDRKSMSKDLERRLKAEGLL